MILLNKPRHWKRSIRTCEIVSFLWLIFVTAYCVPYNAYDPVEEHRFPSPNGLFEAVVAYNAWGGAAGGWDNTLYLVPKNKRLVIRPWWENLLADTPIEGLLEEFLDSPVVVLSGRINSPPTDKERFPEGSYFLPEALWGSNNAVKVLYCGYFDYFRNYGDISVNERKVRIYVEAKDMCSHELKRKVPLSGVSQPVQRSSESSPTPIREDS